MAFEDNRAVIERFIAEINERNLDIIDELVARDFFKSPATAEETAPEVLRQLSADLLGAFPDLNLAVDDFAEEGDNYTFSLTLSGTQSGGLWGAPASGKQASWTSSVTSRFEDGRFAFSWEDLPVPTILAVLRQIDLVPPPEDMDKPPKHPISVPEFLLKLVFTGQVAEKQCDHLHMIQLVEPATDVCERCVAAGDAWPALRMCLICGFIGCCDTSKNKHMKQHYQETGHMLFRSIRLKESWVWCYEDDAFFSGRILEKYA